MKAKKEDRRAIWTKPLQQVVPQLCRQHERNRQQALAAEAVTNLLLLASLPSSG